MEKTKVLLADDHQMFLDGLSSLLSQLKNVEVIAAVNNGQQVLESLSAKKTDLVIVDLNMPLMDGLQTTLEVKKRYPNLKVLVLTMENELQSVKGLLEAGASGYILKNTGRSELELAINQVMNGEAYLSQSISNQMAKNMMQGYRHRDKEADEISSLTSRELEILKMIALENSNTEIANQLYISPKTVETHRKNLMKKIGVRNSLGIYKFAVKHRLLKTD